MQLLGGLPWRFCARVGTGDPGGGGLRFNGPRAAETSVISVSDACLDRRNPDVSRYVGTWDNSSNHDHRGTLILSSAHREGLAIFDIVATSTDHEGWTELAVRSVQAFDSFENNEPVHVQFYRTGDAGDVSKVRDMVVQSGGSDSPVMAAELVTLRRHIETLAGALADTQTQLRQLKGTLGALVLEASSSE